MERVIAPVVLALVASLAAPVAADHDDTDDNLDFVLSGEDGENGFGKIMFKEEHPPDAIVSLSPTRDCETWRAGNAADVDVTFPSQDVEYVVNSTLGNGVELEVDVGVMSSSGIFNAEKGATGSEGTITVDEFTVPEGDYVAFRVCASFGGASVLADIQADGSSFVSFTDDQNPDYPVPELGSLVLLAAGAVAVVGITRVKGRT